MMRPSLSLLILMVVLLNSCQNESEGTLDLVFKPTYDGQAFTLFEKLPYGDAHLLISQSNFIVSNVVLTNENNEEISNGAIDIIDISSVTMDAVSAINGYSMTMSDIPEGNYTHLKFTIGLSDELNLKLPSSFSSDEALSKGDYWDTWDSYVFFKLQGTYQGPAGSGNENIGCVFHLGTNELRREINLPINLNIGPDQNDELSIILDYKKLFEDNGSLFDIPSSPQNHNPILNTAMELIAGNYQSAFNQE